MLLVRHPKFRKFKNFREPPKKKVSPQTEKIIPLFLRSANIIITQTTDLYFLTFIIHFNLIQIKKQIYFER